MCSLAAAKVFTLRESCDVELRRSQAFEESHSPKPEYPIETAQSARVRLEKHDTKAACCSSQALAGACGALVQRERLNPVRMPSFLARGFPLIPFAGECNLLPRRSKYPGTYAFRWLEDHYGPGSCIGWPYLADLAFSELSPDPSQLGSLDLLP